MDLNHRPPGPEPGALARLRYAPTRRMTLGENVRPKGDHQINIALRLRATASQFSNNHASSPEPKECVIFSLYLETRSLQNMLWVQNKTAGKFEPPGGN